MTTSLAGATSRMEAVRDKFVLTVQCSRRLVWKLSGTRCLPIS